MARPGCTNSGNYGDGGVPLFTDADQLTDEPRRRETAHRVCVHLPTATAHGGSFRFLFLDDFFFLFFLVRVRLVYMYVNM
jgi:hypothetical protein